MLQLLLAMEGIASSKFRLALVVLLAVLLYRSWAQGDVHSLQCVSNISFNEQQRCLAQVLVDGTLFLQYDCYNEKVIFEKREVKTTNVLKDMKDTLKDVGDKMRRRLLDFKTGEINRGSSILQVGLECQSNANGSYSGPWEFFLDGQRCLVFDSESGKYKADNSRGKQVKNKWEDEEEVNKSLKKISTGDCRRWLEVLMKRKTELETTAAPAAASAMVPTPAPAPNKAVIIRHNNIAWILIPISVLFIFIVITLMVKHFVRFQNLRDSLCVPV